MSDGPSNLADDFPAVPRNRVSSLLLAAALAAAVAVPAWAAEEGGDSGEISLAAESETSGARAPWRGSEVSYRNVVSLVTLDPSAELTWNPYYAMEWGFKPRWWLDDHWYVGARLDVARELTQSDDTTDAGEAWLGDLLLVTGASRIVTIPWVDIDVSADLILTTPTSKISQARTLALGIGPGVRLARSFDGGGEWQLGYHVRFSSFLHRMTTAELETPLVPSCTRSGNGCDSFLNTGVRNVQWRVQQGVDLSYEPLEWLTLSAAFEHIVDWLYPIESDDPRVSFGVDSPTDQRHASAFGFEVTFVPLPAMELGVGYETISPQLAPDSTYFNPFYNRYSTIYLDLRLEIDGLVAQLTGEEAAPSDAGPGGD